ncbi:MAG TPA: adenylyl-sulfate kinase [Planctomycetaceae bacterium]|jgi:adenylylsulfate kinase|nr:adenylyl-sulfate kinase [Rhodopirellula sp.]HAL14932.1 adenylyl-sulfate kinase [Planctomycetaceae bacterium]HCK72181.1 adenylyl-sulfate kinase [Planctomycetaceae bacterium]|tara:strand:- start:2262 stop:2918 length:657 start_codon:yes stop_codon:yes gene_type:complete
MEKTEITWHDHTVSRSDRENLNGHKGCVIWFTGLSGCGKSTVANAVDHVLHQKGVHTFVLDGDNVRHGLNASPSILESYGEDFADRFGLGFAPEDRTENIRRVGAVAELFASAGVVTLVAFVSPYRADRDQVRKRINDSCAGTFLEVYVNAPLEVCEARDPKGLYKKARAGELTGMTGIDAPYEPPLAPEIHLMSGDHSPDELAAIVIAYLSENGFIS